MRFTRRGSILVVALTSLMGLVGQPGALAAGGGTLIGTGTTTPGLTTTCTVQTSVTFDSVVLVDASTATGVTTTNTHFAGASNGCETLTAGQGSGTLSGGLSGSLNYSRTGNIVTLSGTINGGSLFPIGVCIYVPFSVNPTVTAGWYCVWVTH